MLEGGSGGTPAAPWRRRHGGGGGGRCETPTPDWPVLCLKTLKHLPDRIGSQSPGRFSRNRAPACGGKWEVRKADA
jgi:hypothetical protein